MPRVPLRRRSRLAARLLVLAVALSALTTLPAGSSVADGPSDRVSWRDVPTGTEHQFRGLAAVDADVAWVSGTEGTVLRTADGGRTWKDVSPGGDTGNLQFRDIEAWDSKHAVIMSIGTGRASRIYRTNDGGKTWKLGFKNRSKTAFYDCIGFWDKKHGLAMSDPVDGVFRIQTTDDGGRSWSLVSGGMPAADKGEFGFAASGTCLVTAGRYDAWIASGGESGARVFHTTDRGLTWTVADTPMTYGEAAGIFSLAARDSSSLVAVGGDFTKPDRRRRTSAYSSDAGLTWLRGGDLRGYRSGVAFLPLTPANPEGFGLVAVGPSGSDLSIDGGASWSRIDKGSLDAVECTDDGGCWASGADGRVAVLAGLRGPVA